MDFEFKEPWKWISHCHILMTLGFTCKEYAVSVTESQGNIFY
jgi:hypothetical protein